MLYRLRARARPPAQLGILSCLVLAHESRQAPSSVKRARYVKSGSSLSEKRGSTVGAALIERGPVLKVHPVSMVPTRA